VPRHLTLLLAAAAALVVLASPAAARPVVGIADQKPDMFTDARFLALDITHARYAVGWDAMNSNWQRRQLDHWIDAAQKAGVTPLIVFSQSRTKGRTRIVPTPAQLVSQFRRIRARWPQVREFGAWNEPNYCGQPTCRKPAVVARYWKALRAACPSCTILAGDLLDLPSMDEWVRRWTKAAGRQANIWGLHNYISANRGQTGPTRSLLRVTSGKIWFTETGGIVARRNNSTIRMPQGVRHAASTTRFILERLAPLSPRIQRVYLYQWDVLSRTASWDSGLIGPGSVARPALQVLAKYLGRSLAGVPGTR